MKSTSSASKLYTILFPTLLKTESSCAVVAVAAISTNQLKTLSKKEDRKENSPNADRDSVRNRPRVVYVINRKSSDGFVEDNSRHLRTADLFLEGQGINKGVFYCRKQ